MKYALFTHVPWPQNTDAAKLLSHAADEVCLAEGLGFSSAWIAEHHFTRYGIGSSALVIAGYIAGRTEKIRLGTGVLIPTLHNPIRLAEDAATLDAISGGRLDVGFGRGVYGYEYSGFGVDPATSQERFQESVNVIEGLWTTPEFSHNGQFYNLNKVSLAPPPAQSPHPPIYIAATRAPETLDYCISRGHNLCIAVVMDTAPALDLLSRFVRKADEAGINRPASEVPFFRYMYVAETTEQAIRDTAAHIEWVLDMLFWRNWFKDGGSEITSRHRAVARRARRDAGLPGLRAREPRHRRRPRLLCRAHRRTQTRGGRVSGRQLRHGRPQPREGTAVNGTVRQRGDAARRSAKRRQRRRIRRLNNCAPAGEMLYSRLGQAGTAWLDGCRLTGVERPTLRHFYHRFRAFTPIVQGARVKVRSIRPDKSMNVGVYTNLLG